MTESAISMVVSNDSHLEGLSAGMDGKHFNTNPYDPQIQPERYKEWDLGWNAGRACLEWDNPADVPVRAVGGRLIPAHEERPICSWGEASFPKSKLLLEFCPYVFR